MQDTAAIRAVFGVALLHKQLNNSYETNMFLSGFTGEDDESFFVLFDRLDEDTVQVSGIASAVYIDNTPII
jgi:hypothetical protein